MLFLPAQTPQAPSQIYVSPSGRDTNSGKSWASAFATLDHAIDAAGFGPATIHCRGTIRITNPAVVDSTSNIKIIGEPHTRVTGSALIEGWKKDRFNGIDVWSAETHLTKTPYELFVGPQHARVNRTRLPASGFYHFAAIPKDSAQKAANYFAEDVPTLAHPEEVDAVIHQLWVTSRMPLAKVQPDQHLLQFTKPSLYSLVDSKSDQPSNYYLENAAEALKTPGQWYFDPRASKIYYVPRPGDSLAGFKAETPMLGGVLAIVNSSNIEVQNIEFSGSEFRYPDPVAGDNQAAINVPAAVEIVASHNCILSHDTVNNSGTYGYEVLKDSKDNRIEDCSVIDVGGGGVKISPTTSATTVTDCNLIHLSKIEASAVGIWIGNSGHNVISHNLIQDVGYTGISVGWTWGYGKSEAVDNLIDSNLIRDIGHGELSDMGGIYTLGISPETILRHNRIDHVRCTYYGGWGIYFDEGTSNILAEDNLVTDCQTGGFHQHYGADNLVRNNIFAFAPYIGQVIRTRPEDHTSFTMEGNIIDWQNTPLFGGNLNAITPTASVGIVFKNNLLWQGGPIPDLPPFAINQGNQVANPQFKQNHNLPPTSPAIKMGFKPFNQTTYGPRH